MTRESIRARLEQRGVYRYAGDYPLTALLAVADAAAALVSGTTGVYDGGYCIDCHGWAETGHSEECAVPALMAALAALEAQS